MQPFFCLAIDDCESKTGVALKMVHKPLCRFIRQPCAWLFPVHQCTADTLIDLKRLSVLGDQSTNGGVQRLIRNLSQLPVIVHAVRLAFAATQKIEVWQFLLSPAIRGDQQIQAKSGIAASGFNNMEGKLCQSNRVIAHYQLFEHWLGVPPSRNNHWARLSNTDTSAE